MRKDARLTGQNLITDSVIFEEHVLLIALGPLRSHLSAHTLNGIIAAPVLHFIGLLTVTVNLVKGSYLVQ